MRFFHPQNEMSVAIRKTVEGRKRRKMREVQKGPSCYKETGSKGNAQSLPRTTDVAGRRTSFPASCDVRRVGSDSSVIDASTARALDAPGRG